MFNLPPPDLPSPALVDYAQFDPKAYCDAFFSTMTSSEEQKQMRLFILNAIEDCYNSGKVQGTNLLDFGTGPAMFTMISAARHFSNIYVSDYCEENREVMWRWLSKDPECLDLSRFFKFICENMDVRSDWAQTEKDLREKVRGILYCDMMQSNPLYPCIFPQFEVVSSTLCLDVAPSCTLEAYETAALNVGSLVKPGGWVILAGTLGCHVYQYGQCIFPAVPLTPEIVKTVWTKTGFVVEEWKQFNKKSTGGAEGEIISDSTAMFFMAAQKKSDVR